MIRKKRTKANFFEYLENSNIVDMLFFIVFISERQQIILKISIREISYNVLANYWQLDSRSFEHIQESKILNSIRSKFILKHGLTLDSKIEEESIV